MSFLKERAVSLMQLKIINSIPEGGRLSKSGGLEVARGRCSNFTLFLDAFILQQMFRFWGIL